MLTFEKKLEKNKENKENTIGCLFLVFNLEISTQYHFFK